MNDRKDILLRAAYDMLTKCDTYPYPSPARALVHYDEADCDGYCLRDDIAAELGITTTTKPVETEAQ